MTLKEALSIIEKQREDYATTSDNFEKVFPGAISAYRPLVKAYLTAEQSIAWMIEIYGEDHIIIE